MKIEVISPSDAVAIVIGMLDGSNLSARIRRSLDILLRAAAAAFNRGNRHSTVGILHAFESRVTQEVAPFDFTLAEELVAATHAIVDAISLNHGPPNPTASELLKVRSATDQ